MFKPDYDLIIVGGGMVGASLSQALKNSPLNIALVEAFSIKTDQQPSYDDRGIALSYGSQRIFDTMGLWSQLAPFATAIDQIHVSDQGHFGVTRLTAQQEGVPALGQVILARAMGQVFNHVMQQQENLTIYCPAKVKHLQHSEQYVTVTLDDEQQLTASLIVAADGARSTIRQLLALTATEYNYDQTAITANISTERPHQGRAFERFTQYGPIALLPMSDNRSSLIWTVKTGAETDILALADNDFLAKLQDEFGYRLGQFTHVGQRSSFPLVLTRTDQPVQDRVVFIGNAAHNLHPIAGQGFNLGLRDVATLADILMSDYQDCGDPRLLHDYQVWQQSDQDTVINVTDALVRWFSNNNKLIGHARSASLALLDILPFAKSNLARKSMGLAKKQSRLARGIKL